TGARLIIFDRRGTGLSDAIAEAPALDTMMDDVRAVMDDAGSERAVQIGVTVSCALMALFAATFPERSLGLVLIHALAKTASAPDYPWGESAEDHREETDRIAAGWGTGQFEQWFLADVNDPRADDPRYIAATARYFRHAMSPGMAVLQNRVWFQTDYRHVLPAIHVPTLVVDRRADPAVSGHLAGLIPGAEMVHLPNEPRLPWIPGSDRTAAEIERFVAAIREEQSDLERVLATVLFTDVVDSTARASEMGESVWGERMAEHDQIVRAHLARYRGREIKTLGDGFLATFDGPARAIRCARSIASSVQRTGIDIRAGLHTGELTLRGEDVEGIAVATAARVMSLAEPGEILVSGTVKDLVAGSGLSFEDRGEHALKGVEGTWRLFAVGAGPES
ncbi:MAG TPA: adenylate/guanylate cyclase domain-containing protein, partial [Candidatus Limnocylindria bacterium]|nr:adenylate/guanylate cyclase domain-containing protein [Candidatus Limnocylindria bacterium]